MKTFKNICAQGDVLILRVKKIPDTAKPAQPEGNHFIITHSETGHHHVMEREDVEMFDDSDNPLVAWIKVKRPTPLKHLKDFDTHEPIMFDKDVYKIHRQREYVAEGFRKAQD